MTTITDFPKFLTERREPLPLEGAQPPTDTPLAYASPDSRRLLAKLEAKLSEPPCPIADIAERVLQLTYGDAIALAQGLARHVEATPGDLAAALHAWASNHLNPKEIEAAAQKVERRV